MTGRRWRDGQVEPPGGAGGDAGRVRGAWTTPAVVGRGPHGEVVGGARRIRPRRIPGAPGAVLAGPTLLGRAAGDRGAGRPRRDAAPGGPDAARPPAGDAAPPGTTGGGAGPAGEGAPGPDGGAARHAGRAGPAPTRPGERRQRVTALLAGVRMDRLLPPDDEARARRALRLRRAASTLAAGGLVVVLVYSVFPVRTWLAQRADLQRVREQQEVFEGENDRLAREARELRTDARIEELAREMGMVRPGEESYGIYPAPEEPAEPTATTQPPG